MIVTPLQNMIIHILSSRFARTIAFRLRPTLHTKNRSPLFRPLFAPLISVVLGRGRGQYRWGSTNLVCRCHQARCDMRLMRYATAALKNSCCRSFAQTSGMKREAHCQPGVFVLPRATVASSATYASLRFFWASLGISDYYQGEKGYVVGATGIISRWLLRAHCTLKHLRQSVFARLLFRTFLAIH